MKKFIITALCTALISVPTCTDTQAITFDGFILSESLSYNAETADLAVALYATNEPHDCGDGDMYAVTVPTNELVNYPLGRDVTVTLSNADDGIMGNECIVSINYDSTSVWTCKEVH